MIRHDRSVFSTQHGVQKQARVHECFLKREHHELLSQTWRKWARNKSLGPKCGLLLLLLDRLTHMYTLLQKSQILLEKRSEFTERCDPGATFDAHHWPKYSQQIQSVNKGDVQSKYRTAENAHIHMQMIKDPFSSHRWLHLLGSLFCCTRSHMERLKWQISTQSQPGLATHSKASSLCFSGRAVWSCCIDFSSERCS